MTLTLRDPRHAVLTLTGEPAETLASRLLADGAEEIDAAWADILDRSGASNVGSTRLSHDWDPDAGRLTRDIDIVVRRADLAAIAQAVQSVGLEFRQVAGVDMLVQAESPSARRAVHMIFSGEKVQADYPEATPEIGPVRLVNGIRLAPIEDLIRMKLNSFRLRDQVHLKDLDEAGVITPEAEMLLSPEQKRRLAQVRASR